MASRRDPPVESRPPLPLRRELLADIVAASSPPARAEQPRGRGRGKGQKRAKPGGRAKAIRAADRSDSPPPLAESPTHRTVAPVQEPPVQSAAPEAPRQSAAPEERTPPVQSEPPEQRTPPVQSK